MNKLTTYQYALIIQRSKGYFTTMDVVIAAGCSRQWASKRIGELVDDGLILSDGHVYRVNVDHGMVKDLIEEARAFWGGNNG